VTVPILSRGQNATLPPAPSYTVVVSHATGPDVDLTAFLLDEAGRAAGDEAMVFYNQPDGAGVRWSPPDTAGGVTRHRLEVSPGGWATPKVRIGLTVTGATFAAVAGLRATVHSPSGELFVLDLGTPDAQDALIVGEVYRHRDAVKVRCVGDGFTDGLQGLVTDVGLAVEDDEPAAVEQNRVRQISMTKPAAGAPAVDLRKHAVAVSLVKSGLDGRTFRVVLAIDCSGSTKKLFHSGVMQRSLERMASIADLLDDNGEMEVWFFGDFAVRSAPVRADTAPGYLDRQAADKKRAEGGNFEPRVMKEILDWSAAEPSPHPTLVLFWSDGGVHAERQITELLVRSSNRPVYWMFLGLGRADYGVLARLDDVRGGVVDNAGFLPIDDIDALSDEDLYGQIFGTFVSRWYATAGAAGIVRT